MILIGLLLSIGGCGGFLAARSAMTPASVHVRGYTRQDGTHVNSYNRRPPGSKAKDAPYEFGACCSSLVFIAGVVITVCGFNEDKDKRRLIKGQ